MVKLYAAFWKNIPIPPSRLDRLPPPARQADELFVNPEFGCPGPERERGDGGCSSSYPRIGFPLLCLRLGAGLYARARRRLRSSRRPPGGRRLRLESF